MGRGKLTEAERVALRENPYVLDVSETSIAYSNEFKFLFMEEYLKGKTPTQIFRDAGFDIKMLGSKRIERAAARWRESYESGTLGSKQACISDNNKITYRECSVEPSQNWARALAKQCNQQEKEIQKLTFQIIVLKELREYEQSQECSLEGPMLCEFIDKIAEEHSDISNIASICQLLGINRTFFYIWRQANKLKEDLNYENEFN